MLQCVQRGPRGTRDDLCIVGQTVMWAIMEPPDLRLGAGQCINLPCRDCHWKLFFKFRCIYIL